MEELDALVVRAQAGDLAAFDTIVLRFQDMAVAYACSQLNDFQLAQDVAQEAFICAFLNLEKVRDPSAFPGWFRRAILTQCDRLTRRKQLSTEQLDETGDVASDQKRPDELLDERNLKEEVLTAIEALPESERAVVLLFYIAEHSQKEIASFLEIAVTKVNNRLHTSRKRLRKELRKMESKNLRPSRDQEFSEKVRKHLKGLEKLHSKLASLMGALISVGLGTSTQVKVASVNQETYVDFIESLPNPSCALTFRLAPSEGRVTFNIPMSLAWGLLDHLNHPEAAQRFHREQKVVWEEIQPLVPFFKQAVKNLSPTWEMELDVEASKIVVDTNPLLLLAQPEIRSADPIETVVHLRLDVKTEGISVMLSLCYPPDILRSLLPYLN